MIVQIEKQIGQTGHRKVGTHVEVGDYIAKLWISNGWASQLSTTIKGEIPKDSPKKKTKKKVTKK